MASRRHSVSIGDDTYERLAEHSRGTGESRSAAAERLIDEGLRMARHPGIVFRDGPVGRRAALADGGDIWLIAYHFRDRPLDSEDAITDVVSDAIAGTGLEYEQVRAAIHYYLDYTDEIDEWMRRNDEEAKRAEAEWLRRRQLLRA